MGPYRLGHHFTDAVDPEAGERAWWPRNGPAFAATTKSRPRKGTLVITGRFELGRRG